MRRLFIIVIGMLLFSSCALFTPGIPQLMTFMPRETEVPGWELVKKPEQYREGDIKRYNKTYPAKGVREMAYGLYSSISGKNSRVTVEILKFKDPIGAFGVFSSRKGFTNEPQNNTESKKYSDTYYFSTEKGISSREGEYCVLISLNTQGEEETKEESKKELDGFWRIIMGNLKQYSSKKKLPPFLTLFSANYSRENLLFYPEGIESLPRIKNIFLRKRLLFDAERYIFFTKRSSSYKAGKEYGSILQSKKGGTAKFVVVTSDSRNVAFKTIKKNDEDKFVFISYYKEWIFGVIDADTIQDGNRIIKKLNRELVDYR
ncbi:MAG: hypothetical protein GY754_28030 [bacterium]|nr:hypothetical protein [bacterium]